MTITCTVCGTVNPQDSTFCDGCGVELPAQAPVTAPSTPAVPEVPVSVWDAPESMDASPTAAEPATDLHASAPVVTPLMADVPAGSSTPARLGIKKYGAPTGEFIPLAGSRLTVGRFDASSGPVDIDVSGISGAEHISRRHAELYQDGGRWFVRDLGSTNGVYLKHAGEASFSPRLQEPAALTDGDELAFGNLMLSFHQD